MAVSRTVVVSIEGGAMNREEISAPEGARATLHLTADEPVELHVPGYDLEAEVNPGEPTTLSFEGYLMGRSADHGRETALLGVLLVRPR